MVGCLSSGLPDYIHHQRVVHLDIKPNNIMFASALPNDLRK
jgi:serine/threonine protein kinase